MAQGRKGTGSARNSFRPVPCVIAIDQSYTRTGLAICVRGQVKKATSVKLVNIKSKTMKRAAVQDMLNKAISSCLKHFMCTRGAYQNFYWQSGINRDYSERKQSIYRVQTRCTKSSCFTDCLHC